MLKFPPKLVRQINPASRRLQNPSQIRNLSETPKFSKPLQRSSAQERLERIIKVKKNPDIKTKSIENIFNKITKYANTNSNNRPENTKDEIPVIFNDTKDSNHKIKKGNTTLFEAHTMLAYQLPNKLKNICTDLQKINNKIKTIEVLDKLQKEEIILSLYESEIPEGYMGANRTKNTKSEIALKDLSDKGFDNIFQTLNKENKSTENSNSK